jgi:hypothetical protein
VSTPNPYEAPRTAPDRGGGIAWGVVQIGLAVYALGAIASIPFAIACAEARERWGTYGGDHDFEAASANFYFARLVGDVGLVFAFVVGLVWLYQAWRAAGSRGKPMSASAGRVVGWVLVPVWGTWKLQGFLAELARRRRVGGGEALVQRWWWVLVAHIVLRIVVSTNHVPGWAHVADSVLQATASLLGMHLLWRLQRAPTPAAPS